MNPEGTLLFSTVGITQYGFDVFSIKIPSDFNFTHSSLEERLTDGVSVNFNAQFTNELDENQSLVFISERTGSPQIFLSRLGSNKQAAEKLPTPTQSLFHDRPAIKNGKVYFISAHEQPQKLFTSWNALYSTNLDDKKTTRLTPYGVVDYSPAVSPNGKLIAVASNGSRPWGGEFHELKTGIVLFKESEPSNRTVVCQHGGWPTWADDSCLYFHRQAEDGWWSIFKIEIAEDFERNGEIAPLRITPPGIHVFTPAAMLDGRGIVVATRRRGSKFRHIEIFDVLTQEFIPVTRLTNPDFHHYNPFVSPDSTFLGYHRFGGNSAAGGEKVIPRLDFVTSPEKEIHMFRLNGNFPSFSPDGDFIAFNPDFASNTGLNIVKSDGLKKWTLFKGRVTFYNSWSSTEKNVIFTSIGPIFEKARTSVQIARVSFNLADLDDDHHENESIPVDIKILTREDTGNNAFPSCSPDGKFIVFRSGRSGYKNLFIMDAVNGEIDDGGSIRQLTEGECIDTMPHWSPDGRWIAFSSNRHNPKNEGAFSIYMIRPDGTELRRIHVAGSEEERDRERINHVCFSPDGEWLVFAANLDGVTAEPVSIPNQFQPYGEIYLVRVDGSGLRRLTCSGYENGTPTWHPKNGVDMIGRLGLSCHVGDELGGHFDDPLWILSHV